LTSVETRRRSAPGLAADLVERRLLAVGADVPLDLGEAVDGEVERAAVDSSCRKVEGGAELGGGELGQPLVLSDAMLDVTM